MKKRLRDLIEDIWPYVLIAVCMLILIYAAGN